MKRKHIQKYITFGAVLLCALGAGLWGMDYLDEKRTEEIYKDRIAYIKKASGIEKVPAFHDKLDILRKFINENSQHKIDEEFYSLWRDRIKMADAFIDYLDGRRKDLPHMECASRSGLMSAILKSEGLNTRSVDVYYQGQQGILSSHALFDVYNPEMRRWETQDPEYDVYWKNLETGDRVSMVEAGADDDIVPCNGSNCGWNFISREGNAASNLRNLTAYITVIDRNAGERLTFYRPDILPETIVKYDEKEGTFCDVIAKNCRDGFLISTADNLEMVQD